MRTVLVVALAGFRECANHNERDTTARVKSTKNQSLSNYLLFLAALEEDLGLASVVLTASEMFGSCWGLTVAVGSSWARVRLFAVFAAA